ncbi:flagellar biosynthesis anti-sigma factor FlgM [bacterium]|nr:flagellar biosynthesis anti-sigma factor FlgM [bacterium]
MMISAHGADKAPTVHLNRTYKANSAPNVKQASKTDKVSISKLSALVKQAQAQAMAQPDIRPDAVANAKAALQSGRMAGSGDIASALIGRAVKGQV